MGWRRKVYHVYVQSINSLSSTDVPLCTLQTTARKHPLPGEGLHASGTLSAILNILNNAVIKKHKGERARSQGSYNRNENNDYNSLIDAPRMDYRNMSVQTGLTPTLRKDVTLFTPVSQSRTPSATT